MTRAPFLVPVLLRFPGSAARQDSWGRLLTLTAGGAVLSTPSRLAKGDTMLVSLELGGQRLTLRARTHYARDDDDGHREAELRWVDMKERRLLARALVEVLAKS